MLLHLIVVIAKVVDVQQSVHGDVEACAEQLAELAGLGVTDLILHPLDESPQHESAVLGELLPALAAAPSC